MWFCKNSVFGGISYNVSTIFAKSREKSHRLWTKNLSLARGLLALQIKIPLGIHFLGPWEGGKRFYLFFLVTWTSPPSHPNMHIVHCTAPYLWGSRRTRGGCRWCRWGRPAHPTRDAYSRLGKIGTIWNIFRKRSFPPLRGRYMQVGDTWKG